MRALLQNFFVFYVKKRICALLTIILVCDMIFLDKESNTSVNSCRFSDKTKKTFEKVFLAHYLCNRQADDWKKFLFELVV